MHHPAHPSTLPDTNPVPRPTPAGFTDAGDCKAGQDEWDMAAGDLPGVTARMRAAATGEGGILAEAADHHLARPGKMLRARLALALGRELGLGRAVTLLAAASSELLHNASLIHDDLADRDDSRRGAPAVWAAFGEEAALALGDHLVAASVRLAVDPPAEDAPHMPVEERAGLAACLARATSAAARGQAAETCLVDATGAGADAVTAYEDMVRGKTGALLKLPALAVLAVAPGGRTSASHRAALLRSLDLAGLAYQISDDVADLCGGKKGRPSGGDLRRGRMTAPVLHHLRQSGPAEQDALLRFLSDPDAEGHGYWLRRIRAGPAVPAARAHAAACVTRARAQADAGGPVGAACLPLLRMIGRSMPA